MASKSSNQGKKPNADKKVRTDSTKQAGMKAQSAAKDFVNGSSFSIDPLGSYTGHAKDAGDRPDQDSDDL